MLTVSIVLEGKSFHVAHTAFRQSTKGVRIYRALKESTDRVSGSSIEIQFEKIREELYAMNPYTHSIYFDVRDLNRKS